MSHSHIPVRHLIRQLDTLRSGRKPRDRRPDWLVEFINAAADRFDPLAGVGRVGFESRAVEGRWEVVLYLGSTEVVGGAQDGESLPAAFSFDLLGLLRSFTQVQQLSWTARPRGGDEDGGDGGEGGADRRLDARVTIEGFVGEQPLLLQVCSLPPEEAGPGFRQYANGRCDAV
ncbi:MAG TPA: hypothetical protein VML55_06265 [Planctomycetaceae bacterium]|nr:hypothetical protein [Planctomycetaceae bacterium]